jgi:Ca2+-binding RTX toxin-like protein
VDNRAPATPSAGGPYSIAEGSSLTLNGTATDPDGDTLTVTWDLNGDNVFGDAGVTTLNATVTWAQLVALGITDGNATSTYQAKVRVSDGVAAPATSAAVNLVITNANPTISLISIPAGGPEGVPVNLSASASDPAGAADPLTYTWTVTGPGGFNQILTGTNPSFTPPDNGTFNVSLTVADGDGGSVVSSGNVVVTNVNPLATINGVTTGSSPVLAGAPVPFTLAWTDAAGDLGPGSGSSASYVIVNVATSAVLASGVATNGQTINQSFPASGTFKVTLTVNDGDGGIGVATYTVSIQRFFVDNDGNLEFGGDNNGADKIVLTASGGNVTVTHTVSSKTNRYTLPANPDARIIVYGQGQNDDMRVSGVFPYAVEFHGGAGNDYLAGGAQDDILDGEAGNDTLLGGAGNDQLFGEDGLDKMDGGVGDDYLEGGAGNDSMTGNTGDDTVLGGDGNDSVAGAAGNDYLDGGLGTDILGDTAGNNVLIGGGGNDKLTGGGGRDLLIGGLGLDQITGGGGDDILVSDDIEFGDPINDALAVLDAWANGDADYDTRVDAMFGILDLSMVLDDGVRDTMAGGVGSDWFLTPSLDKIADFGRNAPEERIN